MQPSRTWYRAGARRGVVTLLPLFLAFLVIRRARIAAGMRRGDPAVIDAKRARNKRLANRLVGSVGRAGRRHSIFAVIHFTGRRSGRSYTTPVRVVEEDDNFIIPLTYGPRTSWHLNLQANAGQLQWQGRMIPVGPPTLIPTKTVVHQFPPPSRFLRWLDGTEQCVRLKRADAAVAQEEPIADPAGP